MAKDLHTLSREELGQLFPIIISEPKSHWPYLFLQEKDNIIGLLGKKIAIMVEHIGSTAVPNLPAKPTVDILVEIPNGNDVKTKIINMMTSNGYNYMHEQDNHIMVVKGYTPEGIKGQSYHIHMGTKDHNELGDMLLFRDYLKSNISVADEYSKLKKNLASLHKHDREAYTKAKTTFIKKILAKAKKYL
jgi:GrpB-like predicted nucleotidyltransferase (UPF0157 family)